MANFFFHGFLFKANSNFNDPTFPRGWGEVVQYYKVYLTQGCFKRTIEHYYNQSNYNHFFAIM